jgi:hypothetical protein
VVDLPGNGTLFVGFSGEYGKGSVIARIRELSAVVAETPLMLRFSLYRELPIQIGLLGQILFALLPYYEPEQVPKLR